MNDKQLATILEGVEVWNEWRRANPIERPDLSGAALYTADLSGAALQEASLTGADLSGADLSGADLSGADLTGRANLYRSKLVGANLSKVRLSGTDLREADLREANLTEANLSEANFNGADLYKADLSGADLSGADLTGRANLYRSKLVGANLKGANLKGANLTGADLSGADLSGGANLSVANLYRADLRKADLTGADLSGTMLVETNLREAILTQCRVYGLSAWDIQLDGAVQKNLKITPPGQPEITVDDLEVAQFIYLLLNRRKLRDVITTIGEKAVLILGRFTERKELLDSIAGKLRDLNYLPIIFDFERPTDLDVTETVKILAGMSHFVIADITNPRSVPLEMQATVPDYMVPFVTILQRGQPAFGMFDDLPRKYHWALPLLEYNNPATLLAAFEKKVVGPALEKLEQVRQQKALLPARRSAED